MALLMWTTRLYMLSMLWDVTVSSSFHSLVISGFLALCPPFFFLPRLERNNTDASRVFCIGAHSWTRQTLGYTMDGEHTGLFKFFL